MSNWQEKYIESLIHGYVKLLTFEMMILNFKYWELNKKMEMDKHPLGVVTNVRKSEAIWNIISLIRLKVISLDDLLDFSDELQKEIKSLLDIS